jgi:hypothetical protein
MQAASGLADGQTKGANGTLKINASAGSVFAPIATATKVTQFYGETLLSNP